MSGIALTRSALKKISGAGGANCAQAPCLQNYQGTNFAGACVAYQGQCGCQAGQLTPQIQQACNAS